MLLSGVHTSIMELKVFNISRHVPQSTVRILFSILGDILFFDYYSSVSRRDGTFECVIVYRELSEAQLAAKMDGTELGDRCLEVRLSQTIDRFDITFDSTSTSTSTSSSTGSDPYSRTLLLKSIDMSCDLEHFLNSEAHLQGKIFRAIELERDLGTGLPPLSARFFLLEANSIDEAKVILASTSLAQNFTVVEAPKHMQSFSSASAANGKSNFSTNPDSNTSNTEEVLIYGVPASKLLDPTTTRSYSKSSTRSRSRSRSPDRRRHYDDRDYRDRERERERDRDRGRSHRDYDSRRRSRSRSRERYRR